MSDQTLYKGDGKFWIVWPGEDDRFETEEAATEEAHRRSSVFGGVYYVLEQTIRIEQPPVKLTLDEYSIVYTYEGQQRFVIIPAESKEDAEAQLSAIARSGHIAWASFKSFGRKQDKGGSA